MAATLTGCAPSAETASLAPLPPAPAFVAPVAVPDVQAGDDARVLLAHHRAALAVANGRLIQTRQWYGKLEAAR